MLQQDEVGCSSSGSEEEDDDEDESMEEYRKGGYHAVRVGDCFAGGRYITQRKLGWGQFSTVWLAYDTQCNRYVALKIQKSAPEFAQSALHETEILSAISEGDASGSKCIVRLLDQFKHVGPNGQHICLVTEFLGDSLLRLIRYRNYKGIELDKVKEICRSILVGLDHLHREVGVIHTDLKLENILLVSTIDPAKDPTRSGLTPILTRPEGNINGGILSKNIERKLRMRVRKAAASISERRESMLGSSLPKRSLEGIDLKCKIVDFGNACWADKQFADVIQTRQYRAPEVIIGSRYSFSTDMWSFACIAFELATGDMLFAPKCGNGYSEDEDHLAQMMELVGRIPRKIAAGGSRSKDYFDRHGDLKRIRRLKRWSIDQLLIQKYKFPNLVACEFSRFLHPLLDFSPENRPTAADCLRDHWLQSKDEVEGVEVPNKLDTGVRELQLR